MFKKLEGDTAVIRQGGVYKTSELYEWRGDLFLKFGGGFIRVYHDGKTTKEGVFVESMQTDLDLFRDRFGRVSLSSREGYTPIMLTDEGVLQITDQSRTTK